MPPCFWCSAWIRSFSRPSRIAARTRPMMPAAAGSVIRTPAIKRPTSPIAVAAHLQRNRAEGEDRGHPEADEDALLMAAGEPQRHREDERRERCYENRSGGAEANCAMLHAEAPNCCLPVGLGTSSGRPLDQLIWWRFGEAMVLRDRSAEGLRVRRSADRLARKPVQVRADLWRESDQA